MSTVARGVQEVEVRKQTTWGPGDWTWVWRAFLQNGSGAVFCNHFHRSANGALTCSERMAKAGGHQTLVARPRRKRSAQRKEVTK